MDIRKYFNTHKSDDTSDGADGSEQEAAPYSSTSTRNISTEVKSLTGVNSHARRVSLGGLAHARRVSLGGLAHARRVSLAYVSSRSEAVWCCSLCTPQPPLLFFVT